MIKNRIISIFLLCLLLLVSWHNTLHHSHEVADGKQFAAAHDHHDHHPADHHHDQQDGGILSLLRQLLGDFEHSDLGEDHFKVFLHPQHQTGAQQAAVSLPIAFALLPEPIRFRDWQPLEENDISDRIRSFSDPPFLEIVANKGPPTFS